MNVVIAVAVVVGNVEVIAARAWRRSAPSPSVRVR